MPSKRIWTSLIRMFAFVCLWGVACTAPTTPENGACKTNKDCKTEERCGTKGKCTPIICENNLDCRESWNCNLDTERCQLAPFEGCAKKEDCAAGEICQNRRCVKDTSECKNDTDCPNAKPTCKNGTCIEKKECETEIDCKDPTKPVCKENKCVERTAECEKDVDCKDPTKPACNDGVCGDPRPECTRSDECKDPAKPICSARKCIADSGASEGQACEPGVTDCKNALVCHKANATDKQGLCRTECLTFEPKCDSGKVCRQAQGARGVCVDENKGKTEGEDCSAAPCENNLFCVLWKTGKICAKPCDSTTPKCAAQEECYEVIKGQHLCVSEREPCGPGRPCTGDTVCLGGRCNPKPQCSPACAAEELCDNGNCRKKTCPSEIQCPAGQQCNNGVCGTSTGNPPCVQCNAGQCTNSSARCLSGVGGDPTSYCFDSCATTPCSDTTNFQCQSININFNNVSCTTNANCTSSAPGATCVNSKCQLSGVKLCLPIIGTCTNKCTGVTCSPPTKCLPSTGKCVNTGKQLCETCTANEECGGKDDVCLSFPNNGGSFCGKDCTNDASVCPAKYSCFTLTGSTQKQCAPAALKCPP